MERRQESKALQVWMVFLSIVVAIVLVLLATAGGGSHHKPLFPSAQVETGPDVRELGVGGEPLSVDDLTAIRQTTGHLRLHPTTLADEFNVASGAHVEILAEGRSQFDPEEKITTESILTAMGLMEELYRQRQPLSVPISAIEPPKNGLYRLEQAPESSRYLIFSSKEEGGETFARFQNKSTSVILFELESPIKYRDNYTGLDRNHYLLYRGVCEATLRVRPTHATTVAVFGAAGAPRQEAFEAEDTGRNQLEWYATEGFCEQQGMALNYARDGIPYRQYRQEMGKMTSYGRGTPETLQVSEATYNHYSELQT